MRIFVAGASGVIGVRLVPLLVAAGHEVAGMTRSPEKLDRLTALGARPILCDVYDTEGLRAAVVGFDPDTVIDQLTDLPDDAARIPESAPQIDRVLREGTRNVLGAAEAAGARRVLAQSIAWEPPGERGAGATDPVLGPLTPPFPALQWHHETFSAPGGAVGLASSDACGNQAFRWAARVCYFVRAAWLARRSIAAPI